MTEQPPPPDPVPGPGGYPPPPPSGYQQPGYPPPGHGYGHQPSAGEDRTWILLTHFLGAGVAFLTSGLLGWVVPLISLLARGNQSPQVRAAAVEALNFQVLWSVVTVLGYATMCVFIGFVIAPVAWVIAWLLPVVAGIKAANNEPYRYPMNVSIIK